MREIKFRVYHVDWNKYFENGTDIDSIAYNSQFEMIDLNRVLWEQYTGLKDKNGVEIYENDIVMWRDGESIRYAQVAFAPDIKFLTRDYVFNYGRFAYKDTEKHLTVIGNIHENVDLLEEQ